MPQLCSGPPRCSRGCHRGYTKQMGGIRILLLRISRREIRLRCDVVALVFNSWFALSWGQRPSCAASRQKGGRTRGVWRVEKTKEAPATPQPAPSQLANQTFKAKLRRGARRRTCALLSSFFGARKARRPAWLVRVALLGWPRVALVKASQPAGSGAVYRGRCDIREPRSATSEWRETEHQSGHRPQ